MKQEVERLFTLLSDADAATRERYWREHEVAEEVRREVESLLAFDLGSSAAIRAEVESVANSVVAPAEDWKDLRCGAYVLTEVAGRGGMGVVYRAERADGEVKQSAAIKLLPAGLDEPYARTVFLRERQILAGLEHPGIARLLDAGHLDNGRPYLVMEFVDGRPIDEYARELPVDEKLRLFLSVCRAVAYAHANLVVHRDLKPSNILVNRKGETKLLDFGIARILDVSSTGATQELRLTPDYASPEQVKGEAPTTATDVYSLGAVLYQLLTGHKAHRFTSRSSAAIEAAICKADIVRPSQHVPALRGDLETILMKSLRKGPRERYASVEKLAEDVDAYLHLRPIQARAGEFGYTARKFVRRYWVPIAALSLAVCGLTGGLVTARRERAVAQARFDQVRGLAGQLFEIDRDVSLLPGSSKARERIVRTALEYLGKLSKDTAGNPLLANDVARGYLQVGRVQGVPNSVNLGRTTDAEKTLATAETILRPHLEAASLRAFPDPGLLLLTGAEIAHDRMIMADVAENEPNAMARGAETVTRVEGLEATHPKSYRGVAILLDDVALVYSSFFRMADAVRHARHSVEAARRGKDPVRDRVVLSLALGGQADVLQKNGDLNEALQAIREARQVLPQGEGPGGWYPRFKLEFNEGTTLGGESTVSLNQPLEAASRLQAALDLADESSKRDAKDFSSSIRLCNATTALGAVVLPWDPARALRGYDLCMLRLKEAGNNTKTQRDEAQALALSAAPLRKLNRVNEAKQRLDRSMAILEQAGDHPAGTFPPMSVVHGVLVARADHFGETGRPREAIELYQRILSTLDASPKFRPDADLRHANNLSQILDSLARQYRATGDAHKATAFDARRLKLWQEHDRLRPNNPFIRRRLAAAKS